VTKSFSDSDFSFWGLPRDFSQDDPPGEGDYGDSYAGNDKGITRRNSILIINALCSRRLIVGDDDETSTTPCPEPNISLTRTIEGRKEEYDADSSYRKEGIRQSNGYYGMQEDVQARATGVYGFNVYSEEDNPVDDVDADTAAQLKTYDLSISTSFL